jgi:hypothetical protein
VSAAPEGVEQKKTRTAKELRLQVAPAVLFSGAKGYRFESCRGYLEMARVCDNSGLLSRVRNDVLRVRRRIYSRLYMELSINGYKSVEMPAGGRRL